LKCGKQKKIIKIKSLVILKIAFHPLRKKNNPKAALNLRRKDIGHSGHVLWFLGLKTGKEGSSLEN